MSRFYHPRQGNRQPPCSYHADRPAPERKWRMGRKVPQGIRPGWERPAPSQMEKRGIRTDKGEVNRQIVSDNKLREDLKAVERLRKAADQLARQEQDKSHDRGPELWPIQKNRRIGFPIRRRTVYLPNKSLCDPVRDSVRTSTSSSMR